MIDSKIKFIHKVINNEIGIEDISIVTHDSETHPDIEDILYSFKIFLNRVGFSDEIISDFILDINEELDENTIILSDDYPENKIDELVKKNKKENDNEDNKIKIFELISNKEYINNFKEKLNNNESFLKKVLTVYLKSLKEV